MSVVCQLPHDDMPWMDHTGVMDVMDTLCRDGGDARFVGGVVRDALLKRPIKDIDVATTLLPEEVLQRLRQGSIKAIPTGIDHGTVTAVAQGKPIEITTLRHDLETDGRRAKVAFTTEWQADAARRDFTMNALYVDRSGQVYDYFGGLDDARKGRVRFIGNAEARIKEDALRILRFFRFQAVLGKAPIDEAGLQACIARKMSLKGLSRERIRDELFKLLTAQDPLPVFELMLHHGILDGVVPEGRDLNALKSLVSVEQALGIGDALRRHVALLPKDINVIWDVCKRLKLSNKEIKRAKSMVGNDIHVHGSIADPDAKAALYYLGKEVFIDRLLLNGAGCDVSAVYQLGNTWVAPHFPVTGRDLMSYGLAEGPDVGFVLRKLEKKWVNSGFKLSRDQLLKNADGGS